MPQTTNKERDSQPRIPFKRFVGRLFLLLMPLPALMLIESLFLPLDTFAFRNWEALSVRTLRWAFPGPFYPNRTLERVEIGDLGKGTPYAVRRPVVWITDDFGFRNRRTRDASELDLIIVGDSFISGTGLTQDDLLPEVLERNYGLRSAGFGPSNFKSFTSDPRFSRQIPRIVVVAAAERSLSRLTEPHGSNAEVRRWAAQLGARHQTLMRGIDRLIAPQLFHFVQAQLRPEPRHAIAPKSRPELLLIADHKSKDSITPKLRQSVLERIREYHHYVTERGSQFLFVAIPDKEYCYEELLPDGCWPSLLPGLVATLRGEGIAVVDLAQFFKHAMRQDPSCEVFQSDDSHWNAHGVRMAAEQIAAVISGRSNPSHPAPMSANSDEGQVLSDVRR